MLPVARLGDTTTAGSNILIGSGNVFVENIPMAFLGGAISPTPAGHLPSTIVAGSGSVFVNNIPVARLGDSGITHIHPSVPGPSPILPIIATASGSVFSG